MKIAYGGYLYESRNIATEKQLIEKYSVLNDDSYFFSYRDREHIGLNPKSKWGTPNGLYTYNFKDISGNEIPFKGTNPNGYMYVIKLNDGVKGIDSQTYTKDQLEKDIMKLDIWYKERVEYNANNYTNSSPAKTLWQVTYSIKKTPNEWSNIFLKLGYLYFRDRGEGIIHTNEPIQTVFFSPKAYTVIEYGLHGNVSPFIGTINEEWIKKHINSLSENNIKPIVNYIVKRYDKTEILAISPFVGAHVNKSSIISEILKQVFIKLGFKKTSDILRNNDIFSGIPINASLTKHILDTYYDAIVSGYNTSWLNMLYNEEQLQYIIKYKEMFKNIINISWLSNVSMDIKIKVIEMFKESIGKSINGKSMMMDFVMSITPLSKNNVIKLVELFKDEMLNCLLNGIYSWMRPLFKPHIELYTEYLVNEFEEGTRNLIKKGKLDFINILGDDTRREVSDNFRDFMKIYNKFKPEFEEVIVDDSNTFWTRYNMMFSLFLDNRRYELQYPERKAMIKRLNDDFNEKFSYIL